MRAGPAPIYIGIENNGTDNPAVMARIILSAVQEAGVRATISKQWSTLGTDYQDPNVLFIDDCPPGKFQSQTTKYVTKCYLGTRMAIQARSCSGS